MTGQRNLRTIAWLWLMVAGMAVAQPRDARVPVSSQRVAEALAAAGISATPTQVRFLSPVSASRDSGLEVVSVAHWGNTLKAELRCHDHSACLPFYVLLNGNSQTADALPKESSAQAASSQAAGAAVPIPAQEILMRDGDRATLVFENAAIRITLPVICLQSGNRGQKIRVVSADHKRFFTGEILEPGLLRAAL